jgi:phosphoribosylaminoimidazole-succinocarboxamide synthase
MRRSKVLLEVDIPGLKKFASGKVREIFDLGRELLIVATDRISAFDVVLPNGIPHKGWVLTGLSAFWFDFVRNITSHHLLETDLAEVDGIPQAYKRIIQGRSMIVKKARALPVECIVRGYIAGSAWQDYCRTGTVCGIRLPKGLKESERLPEPIFTPATKSRRGHDQNITLPRMKEIVGKEYTKRLMEKSLTIYRKAAQYALNKGIIISDTKFEFGEMDGELILIDELLTPDSSRFWPARKYAPGKAQPSFDKQFVRDYLDSIHWDRRPPAPRLPSDIVHKTSRKYLQAYRRLVLSRK